MKEKLILIGGGGHCKVCIDIIEQTEKFDIVGILDLPSLLGKVVLDYEVIGSDEDIPKYNNMGYYFFITVGQIKSANLRKQLFNVLQKNNAKIATIYSKSSYCSKYAHIGEGTILLQNVTVNAGATIGKNCILNNGCNIEHDSNIGNHTHISTHAIINGDCNIGDEVFIGSNATISNKINVASKAVVGAGAVVINDILVNQIHVGNPAHKI